MLKPTKQRQSIVESSFLQQNHQYPPLLASPSCGEDLIHNAERILELAPDHCVGCADYHIRAAVQRCFGVAKGITHDRPHLIQLIERIIGERAAASDGIINIVIPGSADTGVLATCAYAVAKLGPSVFDRCRFTVIDRCPTPLLLCREFAGQHHIGLETCQVDLLATSRHFDADLIIVHSLFRFISHLDQVALLNRLGTWLVPGGRMMISTSLRTGEPEEKLSELRKRTFANQKFKETLATGSLKLRESAEQILARLDRSMADAEGRPGEIHSLADARALFARSKLREISAQCLTWDIELEPGDAIRRDRVIALLCRGDEPG